MKKERLKLINAIVILLLCSSSLSYAQKPMSKADSSLSWFKDAKFGMFIHFYLPGDPGTWNPDSLDTDEWVRIAKEAGMKYMVTKAHYNSKVSNRDATDYLDPFKHPYLNELSESCKAAGLRMGCYYGLKDQRNPLYNEPGVGGDIKLYVEYLHAVIKELCEKYEPILIWFDGSLRFRDPEQKKFLRQQDMVDMLHSYGTLSNSRLGDDDALKFVDYLTLNDNMAPDFNVGMHWESAVTISMGGWLFKSYDTELRSTKALLHRLINAAGNGGNLLLNVEPDKHCVIPKNMEDKLKLMGQWLEKNGEAIYGTKAGPYPYQISWGSITQRKEDGITILYLNVLDWPETGEFTLFGLDNKVLDASLLANGEEIGFKSKFEASSGENIITLNIPKKQPDKYVSVIKLVIAGDAVMDQDHLQLTDGKVLLDAYNATIHDLVYVPEKPTKAIDMKMFTTSNRRPQQPSDYTGPWDYHMYRKPGEGIMPGRGLTVSGFHTTGQALSWDFKIYDPGRYQVAVVCHVNKGKDWDIDGRMKVTVAGQTVENQLIESKRVETITISNHLELYSILGTVEIENPGAHSLTLEVSSDFKGPQPRLHGVELIPVNTKLIPLEIASSDRKYLKS